MKNPDVRAMAILVYEAMVYGESAMDIAEGLLAQGVRFPINTTPEQLLLQVEQP